MSLLTRFERWDPFDELTVLRDRMDRLWTRMGSDEPQLANWSPTADVVETRDDVVIKAELAGIAPDDVAIEIDNGTLTIKGERKAEKETEEKGYKRIERSYGTFFRSFGLPPNIDAEKIGASFNNGMLEVHMPKKEETKPRAIKVDVKKQLSTAV